MKDSDARVSTSVVVVVVVVVVVEEEEEQEEREVVDRRVSQGALLDAVRPLFLSIHSVQNLFLVYLLLLSFWIAEREI